MIISDLIFLTRLLVLKLIKLRRKKIPIYFQLLMSKISKLSRFDVMIGDLKKKLFCNPYSNSGRKIYMTLTKVNAKTRL